ncbi:MAG: PASTA domain-containing protein [Bacteroidetes bacterium]|nr:PASTA domain-containing protein [Bacteroidota bacterium]
MDKIKKIINCIYLFFKSKKDLYPFLFIHFILMGILSLFLIIVYFYIFLPIYTRHNKEIIVPDLRGMQIEESNKILNIKKLRFSIKDKKSYSSEFPAKAILNQDPIAGTKVKRNRTIYISLNSEKPPIIKMPNLLNGSLRNAELILKTNELRIGHLRYISNIAKNCVLNQKYKGEKIEPGDPIHKGSKIDLTIGAGLGKEISLPNLVGKNLDEVKNILKSHCLQLGSIIYETKAKTEDKIELNNIIKENLKLESIKEPNDKINEYQKPDFLPNTVFKQIPASNTKVRLGTIVDLWIVDFPERQEKS